MNVEIKKHLPPEVQKVADLCSAPLCVINGTDTLWYPEEEICSCSRKVAVKDFLALDDGSAPKWIKRQHTIKKHTIKKGIKQAGGYFTYEMLNADRMVKGATRGINPDYDESIQMERFFNTNTKKQGVNDEK